MRRAVSRRAGLDVFLQIEDAHGLLLVQLLSALLAELPGEAVRVHVIGAPAPDVDPEPELRLPWALRDALVLAEHHGLDGPARSELPAADVVERAQRILLVEREGRAQLALAGEVLRAVWAADISALDALEAEHGTIGADEVAGRLEANGGLLRELGHYLGSMVRHRGEWFWGVDRFPLLERSLGRTTSVLRWASGVQAPAGLVGEDGTIRIELFFSFRSPYSYLVLKPLFRLAERPNVELVIRPVLPMIMRGLPVPREKRLYILHDVHRLAREQGTPFGRAFDPAGAGVERCMAVFCAVREAGREQAFVTEAARAIWSQAANLTEDGELRPVVERSGLSWADAERALADDAGWRAMAEENRTTMFEELGQWGVPSIRVGGRLAFWGQDRLPILERILDAATTTS